MTTSSTWLHSPVSIHTGVLTDVIEHVPLFDRRPFAFTPSGSESVGENSRLHTIVRLPTGDDPACIPIGVVSKDYALLPHTTVVLAAMQALADARIDPSDVQAELRLTKFGERMALSLRLPDNYLFDPGDSFPITVRLECLNSVDGSTRFRAAMGWYRLVCSNGLTIGITRSASNRRHIGDLQLEHIGAIVRSGLAEYQVERDTLIRWHDQEVSAARLLNWADTAVKACWGFKAATRAFHIARSGCDVAVVGPYRGHSPTTIDVEPVGEVPGSPDESASLFDVSQVLAWLAKERRDIHEQMAWREQIPMLMASLANCLALR